MRLPVLLTTALLSLPLFADNSDKAGKAEAQQISKDSLQNLLIAEFARNRGQYDKALEHYQLEIANYPSAYLAERATRLAMHEKRFPEMLDAAKQWQQLSDNSNSDDHSADFFLALAYSFNQRPVQALEQMRKVLRNGDETDFTRLVSWMPEKESYTDLYLNELRQLYKEHDESYDLPMALAILHIGKAKHKKATKYLIEALHNAEYAPAMVDYAVRFFMRMQKPQKALEVYQAAVELQPFNLPLRQKYAMIATRHDLNTAREQLEIITDQAPHNDYAIYHLALIHLEQNRTDEARTLLQQLLQMQRREDSAHYYLALLDKHQGKLDDALSHLQQIQHPAEQQRSLVTIAQIHLLQNNPELAMQQIETALQQEGESFNRESLQGMKVEILRVQEKPLEAFEYLEQVLQESPDSIDLRYSRAMLAEAHDQLQQAENDLRHILEIEPENALALNALGYTLADRTDRYPEAFELIQQAHELEPEDPAVLDSMGWVLYRMGRYDEAVDYLKTAFTKFPDAEVAAHLGEVLWMMGQKEDAARVLKEALDASPDHNKLNETIKRLDVPL